MTLDSKKMTSLRIAEISGKNHKDVMRSIRSMENSWEKINGRKFALVEYTDTKGEKRPMYELSFEESLFVATKYDDMTRAKIVKEWSQLKQEKEQQSLPPKDISKLIEEENVQYEKSLVTINADINKLYISLCSIPDFVTYNNLLSQKKALQDSISENNKAIKINNRHKSILSIN